MISSDADEAQPLWLQKSPFAKKDFQFSKGCFGSKFQLETFELEPLTWNFLFRRSNFEFPNRTILSLFFREFNSMN